MARKIAGVAGAVASALQNLTALVATNTAKIATNATAIAACGIPIRTDIAQSFTAAIARQAMSNLGITWVLGPSGYISFSNVLTIQWGSVSSGSGGSGSWTYPTTFPNNVYSVLGTATAGGGVAISMSTLSTSNATYFAIGPTGANYNGSVNLIAIGR